MMHFLTKTPYFILNLFSLGLIYANVSCSETGAEVQKTAQPIKVQQGPLKPVVSKTDLNKFLEKNLFFNVRSQEQYTIDGIYTVTAHKIQGEKLIVSNLVPLDLRSDFCKTLDNGTTDAKQRELLKNMLDTYYELTKATLSQKEDCLRDKSQEQKPKVATLAFNVLGVDLSPEALEILGAITQTSLNVISVRRDPKGREMGQPTLGIVPASYEPLVRAVLATQVSRNPAFLGAVKFLVSGEFEFFVTSNLAITSCPDGVREGMCAQLKFKAEL
jgi:hypothetical protein